MASKSSGRGLIELIGLNELIGTPGVVDMAFPFSFSFDVQRSAFNVRR